MKKIEKVSIADISFTLDNDAYASLRKYLGSLHDYYDSDPDGGEIIADIEARIAELILNEQIYTKIVSKRLIESIITQLGTPQEMDDDEAAQRRAAGISQPEHSIPRRLYRSREGKIFGGVCSGMAQFWNVNVTWIRLLFLAPLILFFFVAPFRWDGLRDFLLGCSWGFLIIYIVLWMAIPMARTPRQKLESRGEKITPSSIRQNLQENAKTPSAKKAASVIAEMLAVVGRIILFFIKLFVAIIGFALLLSALVILFAIIVALVNPATVGAAALSVLSGMSILSPTLFIILVLFCIMIPLWLVGTALLGLVFNRKPGTVFYAILLGVWLLAMVFCAVVAASNARVLRDGFRHDPTELFESGRNTVKDTGKISDEDELRDFLRREDNGMNTIEINAIGDSVEVVAWRDHTADSTYVSTDGVLKYRSRIVLKEKAAIGKALLEKAKRARRTAGTEVSE